MPPPKGKAALAKPPNPNRTRGHDNGSVDDSQLPSADGAERSILGCILAGDGERLQILDKLTPSHFTDERHRCLFMVAKEVAFDINAVSIAEEVQARGHPGAPDARSFAALASLGGLEYFGTLQTHYFSAESVPIWIEELEQAKAQRAALSDIDAAKMRLLDGDKDGALELLDMGRERLSMGGSSSKPLSWESLLQPVDYSSNLLGNRFLERGQGFLLYGPAGCGKSTAALQACCWWAAGQSGLHIQPAKPLRIVVLQTEDSLDDTRESLAGILSSDPLLSHLARIRENLIILPPVPSGNARDLERHLGSVARDFRPDLVLLNPLLAFVSGDPARELGGLLYQTLDPILKRHQFGLLGVHHTPKTNNRDTSGYGAHDHQYLAAGDARVANWPRAMLQIEPVAIGVYLFRLAKRGGRAGWTWDGVPTIERHFKWAVGQVRWIDADPAEITEAKSAENYRTILEVLPTSDQPGITRDRLYLEAKAKLSIGKSKSESWLKLVLEDQLAVRVETMNDKKRLVVSFRQKGTQQEKTNVSETP